MSTDNAPLLFIDVDGVLNTLAHSAHAIGSTDADAVASASDCCFPTEWHDKMRDNLCVLSQARLDTFSELVRTLGARIVLSTSWRSDEKIARPALLAAFEMVGIAGKVIGQTPDLYGKSDFIFPVGTRYDEIATWLANEYDTEAERPIWFAIDDMPLVEQAPPALAENFILTDASYGLTDKLAAECVERARRLAGREGAKLGAHTVVPSVPFASAGTPPQSVPPARAWAGTRLVVISDTHGQHRALTLPEGDVLIHAGDFTRFGLKQDAIDFNEWLGTLPYAHKLVVLGNHEVNASWVSDTRALLSNATFLCDSGVSLPLSASSAAPSLHVWGTAFYWPKEGYFEPPFATIPAEVDVLITHGPAASHVDGGAGCKYLLEHIERIQPHIVCCGHIHQARGVCKGHTPSLERVTFVNAANAGGASKKETHSRKLRWPPIVIDLPQLDNCLPNCNFP